MAPAPRVTWFAGGLRSALRLLTCSSLLSALSSVLDATGFFFKRHSIIGILFEEF